MDKYPKETITQTENGVKDAETESRVNDGALPEQEERINRIKKRAKKLYPHNVPFSRFSEKQKGAQMKIIDVVLNQESGKAIVIPAPPGSGKSTVIPVIMAIMGGNKEGSVPMLAMTDKLDRLKEYKEADAFELIKDWRVCGRELSHVDLLKKTMDLSEPGVDVTAGMIQMKYKSNLMMTTQKYACMSEESKKSVMEFLHNGMKEQRMLILVDEAPEIYGTGEVSLKTVADVGTTLQEVAEGEENQQFIYELFKELCDYLYGLFMHLDQCSSQTTITIPVRFAGQELLSADQQIKEIVADQQIKEIVADKLDLIYEIDQGFLEKYRALKAFLEVGGIYVSQKKDEGKKNPNRRRILVPLDYSQDYVFPGCKTIILDGTADIDWRYAGKENYRMEEMDEYQREFSNLGIRFYDMTTSKAFFREHKDIQERIIRECLKCSVDRSGKDILVVTYKEIEELVRRVAKSMGIREDNITHWGAVTGSNHWRNLKGMCIIGLNRKKMIDYMINACAVNPELWNQLFQFEKNDAMEREVIINELNRISANHGSKRFSDLVVATEDLFLRNTHVELEQAIYRTKLRDYNSEEPINIDIFCRVSGTGSYAELVERIKTSFREADVEIFEKPQGVTILLNATKTPRAGTDGTAVQKTLLYLQTLPSGTKFTKKAIAEATGISYSMLTHKVCLQPEIKAILQKWKEAGHYRKP